MTSIENSGSEFGNTSTRYLCATNLEVGLLLHFGRDPTFSRVICEKHFKRHRKRDRR
jgi:hypothetical protein